MEEYNRKLCSHHLLGKLDVPLLSLNSDDDWILPVDLRPGEEEILKNKNIIQLNFKSGGHIEYFHGWKAQMVRFSLI